MYLMYYLGEDGKRVYTLKVSERRTSSGVFIETLENSFSEEMYAFYGFSSLFWGGNGFTVCGLSVMLLHR